MSFSSMPSRRMIGVGGAEEIGRQRKRCVDTRDFLYFQRYFLLEHILINHVQNLPSENSSNVVITEGSERMSPDTDSESSDV